MKKQVRDEFNDQIKYEAESAYLYLAMAAWFEGENLKGMAGWMRAQAAEEIGHAWRFQNHLIDREARVTFQPLGIKKTQWKSPLEAFQDALVHEKFITSRIHHLVEVADKHADKPARNMLEWFVNEQIEEEANASKIVADLKRVGSDGYGLLMLDRELGARLATMPATGPAATGAGV